MQPPRACPLLRGTTWVCGKNPNSTPTSLTSIPHRTPSVHATKKPPHKMSQLKWPTPRTHSWCQGSVSAQCLPASQALPTPALTKPWNKDELGRMICGGPDQRVSPPASVTMATSEEARKTGSLAVPPSALAPGHSMGRGTVTQCLSPSHQDSPRLQSPSGNVTASIRPEAPPRDLPLR